MRIGTLASLLLDHFLGIVPGSSGVGLEDRHQDPGCGNPGQQTTEHLGPGSGHKSDGYRHGNSKQTRQNHFSDRSFC